MPTITLTADGWTISYPTGEQVFFMSRRAAEEFLDWRENQTRN